MKLRAAGLKAFVPLVPLVVRVVASVAERCVDRMDARRTTDAPATPEAAPEPPRRRRQRRTTDTPATPEAP